VTTQGVSPPLPEPDETEPCSGPAAGHEAIWSVLGTQARQQRFPPDNRL